MDNSHIRRAEPKDIKSVIKLCELHALFECSIYESKGKAEKLNKSIFRENPFIFCLVAEKNDKLIGYATATKEFSTWDAEFFLQYGLFIRC